MYWNSLFKESKEKYLKQRKMAAKSNFLILMFLLNKVFKRKRNQSEARLKKMMRQHSKSSSASRISSYLRRRNNMILHFICCLYTAVLQSRSNRSIWMRQRTDEFWSGVVNNKGFTEEMWVENFRMKKETFKMLCNKLGPYIKRKDTVLRKCISVEKRIAICLWTLATTCEYRTISHLFGVSIASVCLILKEVSHCIKTVLLKEYIFLPKADELDRVLLTFERKWGFPNCAGAIDGCHIPIIRPKEDHTDYYNRKGWYSILLQAVVDSNYLFRDTCIGWPGRVHDARVLANSAIYARGQQGGDLFPNERREISGVEVPVVILGDPAYPLLQWLMKPYPDTRNTTPQQKKFNYMLSRNRMVIENSFGRLKGRWRRLQKRLDCDIKDSPTIILACYILHNICELQGDEFKDQWNLDSEHDNLYTDNFQGPDSDACTSAGSIRDAFCRFFNE